VWNTHVLGPRHSLEKENGKRERGVGGNKPYVVLHLIGHVRIAKIMETGSPAKKF